MRKLRFFAFAVISFVAALFAAFLSPSIWLHKSLAIALCGILSANPTLCTNTAMIAAQSQEASATNPVKVETTQFSDLLAQRSRDFDDDTPKSPSSNPNNPKPPSYPNEVSPNTPVRRPDFDGSNTNRSIFSESNRYRTTGITETGEQYQAEIALNSQEGLTQVLFTTRNTSQNDTYYFNIGLSPQSIKVVKNEVETMEVQEESNNTWNIRFANSSSNISKNWSTPKEVKNYKSFQKYQTLIEKVGDNLDNRDFFISNNDDPSISFINYLLDSLIKSIFPEFKKRVELFKDIDGSLKEPEKKQVQSWIDKTFKKVKELAEDVKKQNNETGNMANNKFNPNITRPNQQPKSPTQRPNSCADPSAFPSRISVQPKQGCTCIYSVMTQLPAYLSPTKQDVCSRQGGFRAQCGSDLELQAQNQLTSEGTRVGVFDGTAQIEALQCSSVSARITKVDDVATLYIDGVKVLEGRYPPSPLKQGAWTPINVGKGQHTVRMVVNNTQPGESGGWFEIRIGDKTVIDTGHPYQEDRTTGIKFDQTTTITVP